MKTYTKEELNKILELHKKWINKELDGVRASLGGVDLNGANLSYADLSSVYFGNSNLSGANLSYADLSSAYLGDADLRGADLTNTKLTKIYLWDFIKEQPIQTTPTLSKTKINPNAGKLFKVKETGKIGFILPYQFFEGWNYGFLDGKKGDFEMSDGVEILEQKSAGA